MSADAAPSDTTPAAAEPKPSPLAELYRRLRFRYDSAAGWVLVEEVADGTGANASGRRADALALQTWPSRGLGLEGFEVKVSRSDLQRELRDPAKADALGRYCRHWWLVVPARGMLEGLVIPATWGVLVPHGKGLRAAVEAPPLPAAPVDLDLVCSLVRRAHEQRPAAEVVEAARNEEGERWRQSALKDAERAAEGEKHRAEVLARVGAVLLEQLGPPTDTGHDRQTWEALLGRALADRYSCWDSERVAKALREKIGRARCGREGAALLEALPGLQRDLADARGAAERALEAVARALAAGDPSKAESPGREDAP